MPRPRPGRLVVNLQIAGFLAPRVVIVAQKTFYDTLYAYKGAEAQAREPVVPLRWRRAPVVQPPRQSVAVWIHAGGDREEIER